MKEANNSFIKIKMEILPNMRNWRLRTKRCDFSDENALKVAVKNSVVLVTRLGMYPSIP